VRETYSTTVRYVVTVFCQRSKRQVAQDDAGMLTAMCEALKSHDCKCRSVVEGPQGPTASANPFATISRRTDSCTGRARELIRQRKHDAPHKPSTRPGVRAVYITSSVYATSSVCAGDIVSPRVACATVDTVAVATRTTGLTPAVRVLPRDEPDSGANRAPPPPQPRSGTTRMPGARENPAAVSVLCRADLGGAASAHFSRANFWRHRALQSGRSSTCARGGAIIRLPPHVPRIRASNTRRRDRRYCGRPRHVLYGARYAQSPARVAGTFAPDRRAGGSAR
jgi:hypothetical protein